VTFGSHANLEVNTPTRQPPPSPFHMSSLNLMVTVVRLCGELELMAHSKRELDYARPGTKRLHTVNSALMEHSSIKSATNMKVSIGNCLIVLVFIQV
jgi:hypothetical protein